MPKCEVILSNGDRRSVEADGYDIHAGNFVVLKRRWKMEDGQIGEQSVAVFHQPRAVLLPQPDVIASG